MENLNSWLYISKIIAKEKLNEISDKDRLELENWLNQNDDNREIYRQLNEDKNLIENINELEKFNTREAFKKVQILINADNRPKVLPFIPNLIKYAAAILIFLFGTYMVFNYLNKSKIDQFAENKITPGTQKAILTTSENTTIELGKTQKKTIFRQKRALLVDTSATLTYNKDIENSMADNFRLEYNQLETPRGSEYTVVLSDGTKVMLNAETKLKFPVIFDNNIREVELKGEAYFEVAKSEYAQFIVKVNGMKVKVYGTRFNISGYGTDGFIQTTLVEGTVGIEVSKDNRQKEYSMVPGQQANYDKLTAEIELKKVNTGLYTAWTKGIFAFNNEPLESILLKLGRWYNVDFEFKDNSIKNEPFTGDLKRYEDINRILEMLSIASDIDFEIEGQQIMVYKLNN